MSTVVEVNYKVVSPGAAEPCYATPGAAGMDLAACLSQPLVLKPRTVGMVPTGIAIQISRREYAGLVFARSGLAARYGIALANGVGVIDSDYTGEIVCALLNNSDQPFTVNPGDRIAQLVLVPIGVAKLKLVENLAPTHRGDGGFGSTGR